MRVIMALLCMLGLAATTVYADDQTAAIQPFSLPTENVTKGDAPMPPIVVLIVCKSEEYGKPDKNAKWTGVEHRRWIYENSMMQCRRIEVPMFDQAEAMGAKVQPFNQQRCQRASIMLGVNWDMAHKSSKYRFYRVACPTPVTINGRIVKWNPPECGNRDTMVCENDISI